MIVEQAIFSITEGSERAFEAAMEEARHVIAEAKGFRSLKLLRGIEEPSTYLLINEWEEFDDHVIGFRQSDLFVRWRALIERYFAAIPEVEHFEAPILTS